MAKGVGWKPPTGGLTGWLLERLRSKGRPRPQLTVLERITLAPRQTLALIEAGGQRLLVATSADGTPAFYPVGGRARQEALQGKEPDRSSRGRISW
jgi:flagellar biogenesis protein FliO